MNNIQPSVDVKQNRSEKERKGMKVAVSIFVVMIVIGIGFSFYPAQGATVEQKQNILMNRIKDIAIEVCEQNKLILQEQVEGGRKYNLSVEAEAQTLKNLEVAENCYGHVADLLSGDKVLGK